MEQRGHKNQISGSRAGLEKNTVEWSGGLQKEM